MFDQPAVACAVPGPRNAEQMRATLQYLEASEAEKEYSGVVGNLREILAGQCTYCQHCLPCQEGIEIGWVIWDLDQIPARGIEQIKEWYAGFPVKASACVECGVCVERCPFDVDIIAKMREAAAVFEGESGIRATKEQSSCKTVLGYNDIISVRPGSPSSSNHLYHPTRTAGHLGRALVGILLSGRHSFDAAPEWWNLLPVCRKGIPGDERSGKEEMRCFSWKSRC